MRLTSVELAAVAAMDFIREGVVRGIHARDIARRRHLAFDLLEHFRAYYRFMVLFNVVLRQLTPVYLLFLGEKVIRIPLL